MKRTIATLLIVAMAGTLPGCANMSDTGKGAAVGALAGGILGAVTGNSNTAIKGALIGAAVGAAVGYYSDKQTATRADAAKKYKYVANNGGNQLEIDSGSLTPPSAQSGESVESTVQYTALAADEKQKVKIIETRTLVGPQDTMQLTQREVMRPQGTHVSSMKFTIPKDIPKGRYTLVTSISDGKQTKTVKKALKVI